MIGTILGPYKILEPLGAGGMGEVWLAEDTRLGRQVAIKVLPAELSSDPELRARFEREARLVSELNHANVCTLHDIGRDEGVDYLVMEYLEGNTLADRLADGPMPLREALEIGAQIADALSAAHARGIVHRDLKPGNVMLTAGGAKLLDFGIAKLSDKQATVAVATVARTSASPLTGDGKLGYLWSRRDLGQTRVQLSIAGGTNPAWGRDMTELFFSTEANVVSVALDFEPGGELRGYDEPERLFEHDGDFEIGDRDRFLLLRVEDPVPLAPIELIFNWRRKLES